MSKPKSILFLPLLIALLVVLLGAGCGRVSDAEIQKAAENAITDAGITGVSVVVNGGIATVSGEVADEAARKRVLLLTQNAGPNSIVDKTTIKPIARVRFETDPELKKRIGDALQSAGCTGADVSSNEKSIFLVGEVTEEKYAECIRVANRAAGEKVENNLRFREK